MYKEVYLSAATALDKLSAGASRGSWAVILDADETVLDNSTYQKERAEVDSAYTEESWTRWVRRREAGVLPGAIAFTQRVHQLEGKVIIVTNRNENSCDDTRANLASVSVAADLVLCRTGVSDKNPRFRSVADGTASPSMPALKILEWIGDNILDFPMLAQSARDRDEALAEFGKTFFLLPNPMYGSWERLPYR